MALSGGSPMASRKACRRHSYNSQQDALKMDESDFQHMLNGASNFELRRSVERLRDGLFDSLGVRLLTSGEAKLNQSFDRGVNGSCLCVCGAYGQGKSHSLNYIKQRALDRGFLVSYINLDPREIPFHRFNNVYRALMEGITLPNGEKSFVDAWKRCAGEWLALPENRQKTCLDLIPENIPHRFKSILTAMVQQNISIPPKKMKLKKHARFKPREFPWILKNAIMGKEIPDWRLRPALHYRQVSFYKENSLVCRGDDQYFDMVQGMAELFRRIGFKGWVLLFDEGESIVQTRITCRRKSYRLLDKFFSPGSASPGFYPVFAFTDDFFARLEQEDYDRVKIMAAAEDGSETRHEVPYFEKNYSRAWEDINIHRLQDLSAEEWKTLIIKLIFLHGRAYGWQPPEDLMQEEMACEVLKFEGVEARLKLKMLVNHLDLEHQEQYWNQRASLN